MLVGAYFAVRCAEATLDSEENGVAFDKAKTEAMFLSKRKNPMESVRVGDYEVQINQHATGGSVSGSTPK